MTDQGVSQRLHLPSFVTSCDFTPLLLRTRTIVDKKKMKVDIER